MNRNVEDDIEGLLKIFRHCFTRNDKAIPKYKGVEPHRHAGLEKFSVKDNLNGKMYDYHLEQGRDICDILLYLAWKLGYNLCYQNEVVEKGFFYRTMANKYISQNKEALVGLEINSHHNDTNDKEGIQIALIDSIKLNLKILILLGFDGSGTELIDALKDLREDENLLSIITQKTDKMGNKYFIEREDWHRKRNLI